MVVIDMLKIDNLTVSADDKIILNNLNLDINDGEIHVLMGQNGTGKSTLSKVLMAHPDYKILNGSIIYNDKAINDLDTTSISRLGVFLLSQNPIEIEGISNSEMLRNTLSEINNEKVDIFKFNKKLTEVCNIIEMPKEYVHRDINFNMSGGEKKKNELLHLFMLEPKFVILDEIDSGLDVDALKVVGTSLKKYYDLYKPSILIITHHADILKLFTVAPEMDGALECIKKVYEDGRVLVSMGHTGASFDEANEGIKAGVRHTTHLFNAMTALQHRSPGVVGAALSDERVSCELIADTFHVNPGLYKLVAKAKGDKLCLITDCMRAGGMEDGDYTLGGQHVIKTGIQCLLEDGTIAGSVLELNAAVRNLKEHTELSLPEVFACASLNPAKAVGEADKIGSLEVGKCADIIICDDEINVMTTIIDGEIFE